MKRILVITFITLIALSIGATYYRYFVRGDFTYETKPLDEFTEDDL